MSRSPLLPHRAPQPSPLPVERPLPEEVPLALVYNGSTLAVMMGTPEDLEDFATGFSLSEGIVTRPADLGEIEVLRHPSGIELRMWLPNNQ
ncbi:MAG: formate dehydrogenase accessory sulfurtransferase FdhD, partial [Paracoccaceae bacterium]